MCQAKVFKAARSDFLCRKRGKGLGTDFPKSGQVEVVNTGTGVGDG